MRTVLSERGFSRFRERWGDVRRATQMWTPPVEMLLNRSQASDRCKANLIRFFAPSPVEYGLRGLNIVAVGKRRDVFACLQTFLVVYPVKYLKMKRMNTEIANKNTYGVRIIL